MESKIITIAPHTDFKEWKADPPSVPLPNTLHRSSRIKNIQTTAMILLFLAAVIN
ncbi:MFS transporter, partial [Klebsiella pneumoniae]